MTPRKPLALLAALYIGGITGAMGGCEGVPATIDRKEGSSAQDSGLSDADDINVSIDAALARAGIAPVAVENRPDGSRVWELRNARDEPGELIVRVGSAQTEGGPIPVHMTCRIGRFGDPETERLILESAAKRMEQLRGRGVYRITW
ncbi:MAG: hypothetical protein KF838_15165 [Phycisphaeraceae bacterium]|nr:MAG: hypothetical protein KF838_15165 [Phycisphaeraceae bacterium]